MNEKTVTTKKNWLDLDFGAYALIFVSASLLITIVFFTFFTVTSTNTKVEQLKKENDSLNNQVLKLDSNILYYPIK